MRSPGRDRHADADGAGILRILGPSVMTISGVKIYDTKVLTGPPLSLGQNGEMFGRFIRQPDNKLSHIFIGDAEGFIEEVRKSNQEVDGLFPTLDLTISILATAFSLLYDQILSRADQNSKAQQLLNNLIFVRYQTRYLGLEFLIDTQYTQFWFKDNEADLALLKEVESMIKLSYESLGYEFSYFGFVKKEHPLRMAKVGKIPLKPNTFEAFGLFHLAPDAYLEKAQNINGLHRENSRNRKSCLNGVSNDIYRMGGWKKQDLVDAIKRSGLWKNVSGLQRLGRREAGAENKGIAFKDLGLADPFPQQQVVRGLGRIPYMALCYYETLYRKIYQTTDYIDWPLLCQLNAVSLENIRKAAIDLYQAKPEQIANASAGQICAYVTETANKRKAVTKTLALSAQEAKEGFVGQPGSRWVQPLTMQRRGPLGEFIVPPTNDYQMYKAVKQYCQNQQISKEQMIAYAVALNIRSYLPDNLDQYSKDDICEYLLDFLLPKAQKYESVLIDCADPAIGVRQILNAATIMELDNIFPKDVSKLTKEQACEIISAYIQLLRDQSSLRFA